jgi:hypothetical protein
MGPCITSLHMTILSARVKTPATGSSLDMHGARHTSVCTVLACPTPHPWYVVAPGNQALEH